MKRIRHNKLLGVAIGDRSLTVAEVVRGAGDGAATARVTRAAEFAYPEGVTLQQPDALGKALAQFLRESGFTARAAVLGIPARWVLSKPKEVPPAGPEIVAETLRLQAEGDFPPELGDFVYDYAGEASASEARTVLLLAVPQRYLDQLTELARGARLDVAAITPVAAAVAAVSARKAAQSGATAKDALVLSLGPGGAEFVAHRGPHARAFRHLGSATSPALLGELRRAVTAAPPAGGGGGGPPEVPAASGGARSANGNGKRGLTVWGGAGLDPATRTAMSEALGLTVEPGNLAALGVAAEADDLGAAGNAAPAVALALAGLAEEGPPVDFVHSRLAVEPPPKVGHRTVLAAVAGVAVLVGAILAFMDLGRQERELTGLQASVVSNEPNIKTAKASVAQFEYAQRWHNAQPRFLACLRDLTLAIPDDGQIIATSLNLRDNMKGVCSGKSASDRAVLALPDRLKSSKHFTDVKVVGFDAREVQRTGREVSFSIAFTYLP